MRKKRICLVVVLIASILMLPACLFLKHAWEYYVESSVHSRFYPILVAIYKYTDDSGLRPDDLDELVPKYLNEVPKNHFCNDVKYIKLEDGKWEMVISYRSIWIDAELIHRSDSDYSMYNTAKGEARVIHDSWCIITQ